MNYAVQAREIHKYFRFGRGHKTFFDVIEKNFLKPVYKNGYTNGKQFHALKGISFDIPKGERIAIIGNNGSGKTTLLKTIAGLYQPNKGEIFVSGKMVLLAGLGIGMVGDLTIEENLYLYGAIYGMNREIIRSKFEDILEWAELTEFMHSQLKTLSTGMKTRIAFSAARHIDADVFLMDEALSAGDKDFRHKCEDYFEQCKGNGKTFVVATHNLSFVQGFCSKALWLKKGNLMAYDDIDKVLDLYDNNGSA